MSVLTLSDVHRLTAPHNLRVAVRDLTAWRRSCFADRHLRCIKLDGLFFAIRQAAKCGTVLLTGGTWEEDDVGMVALCVRHEASGLVAVDVNGLAGPPSRSRLPILWPSLSPWGGKGFHRRLQRWAAAILEEGRM